MQLISQDNELFKFQFVGIDFEKSWIKRGAIRPVKTKCPFAFADGFSNERCGQRDTASAIRFSPQSEPHNDWKMEAL